MGERYRMCQRTGINTHSLRTNDYTTEVTVVAAYSPSRGEPVREAHHRCPHADGVSCCYSPLPTLCSSINLALGRLTLTRYYTEDSTIQQRSQRHLRHVCRPSDHYLRKRYIKSQFPSEARMWFHVTTAVSTQQEPGYKL